MVHFVVPFFFPVTTPVLESTFAIFLSFILKLNAAVELTGLIVVLMTMLFFLFTVYVFFAAFIFLFLLLSLSLQALP